MLPQKLHDIHRGRQVAPECGIVQAVCVLFDTLHYIAYLAVSLQLLRVDLFSLNGLQLCRWAAVG